MHQTTGPSQVEVPSPAEDRVSHERRVAEAVSQGLPPPRRSTMNEVYGIPSDDTRIFDINRGE